MDWFVEGSLQTVVSSVASQEWLFSCSSIPLIDLSGDMPLCSSVSGAVQDGDRGKLTANGRQEAVIQNSSCTSRLS